MDFFFVRQATIISAIIGTLIMGLVANVPYAQAPGMGLNAFFVYTVCFQLGFIWQQAMTMIFIRGLINILITVTKVRKHIIKAIQKNLQNAISAFLAAFVSAVPSAATAPALVAVGCMMMPAFKEIDWSGFAEFRAPDDSVNEY